MKLTCFPLINNPCEVAPGRPEREWMDVFTSKQPYRCLPLVIANTTGWEVITPTPFTATWDGDPNRHVKIESPFGYPVKAHERFVGSHFGGGTLTFHTGSVFRTEPGWDLWCGGAPNTIKHGIVALTGVVETWWLPQHFTMNWRFTAPGTVSFAAGEPFCFVMPIPHTAIDECEPIIKSLDADPEFKARNKDWQVSRDNFINATRHRDVNDPSQAWEKHYFKGEYADGSPGPAEHMHRRRLKPARPARDGE